MLKRLLLISTLIVTTWVFIGDVQLEDPSALQQRAEVALPLQTANPIEQSFVPQRDNLTAVAVRIDEQINSNGRAIRYHLIQRGEIEREVASGYATRGDGEDTGYYFLRFPSQRASSHVGYVLRLERVDSKADTVSVWASNDDEYENGQASRGGRTINGDIAFKLYYEYTPATLIGDLTGAFSGSALVILAAAALLILPGLAMLSILPSDSSATLLDTFALGVGLSIALIPSVLSVMTTVGLRLSPSALWLWLSVCALIAGVWVWRSARRNVRLPANQPYDVAMLGLLAAGIVISLVAVREVRFPLLLDSCHHTLVTQLIIEKGQVPSNYLPHYPFDQFTYHFGFHAIAAFLSQLAGLQSQQSVILSGQLVNALTGLTLYVAVARLTESRRVAFFAAATVLLLNHIPASYVNWGRYTQLTGQTLLPIFMFVAIEAFRTGQSPVRWLLLMVVLSAGLFFIHYRIMLFGAMFVLAYGLAQIDRVSLSPHCFASVVSSVIPCLKRAALIIAGTLLLTGPWLWNIGQNLLANILFPSAERDAIMVEEAADIGEYFRFHVESITLHGVSLLVLALAVVGLFVALRRHSDFARAILIWVILLVGGAYLYLVTPRLGLYSITIVIIALYLPAGILAGFTLDAIWDGWTGIWRRVSPHPRWQSAVDFFRLICFVVTLTLFGMQRMSEVRLENGFVRPADEKAMEWIRSNTPATAKFMVASDFWNPVMVGGQDAGSWLPLLTGRESTVPTFLYASDGSPAFLAYTNRLAHELNNLRHPAQSLETLRQNGIGYVYVGNRPSALIPAKLNNVDGFEVVYHREGVWVFKVRQS